MKKRKWVPCHVMAQLLLSTHSLSRVSLSFPFFSFNLFSLLHFFFHSSLSFLLCVALWRGCGGLWRELGKDGLKEEAHQKKRVRGGNGTDFCDITWHEVDEEIDEMVIELLKGRVKKRNKGMKVSLVCRFFFSLLFRLRRIAALHFTWGFGSSKGWEGGDEVRSGQIRKSQMQKLSTTVYCTCFFFALLNLCVQANIHTNIYYYL